MAFDERQSTPTIFDDRSAYRQRMQNLGHGLLWLAAFHLALIVLLSVFQFDALPVAVFASIAAALVGMGMMAVYEHFWVNYLVILCSGTIIAISLFGLRKTFDQYALLLIPAALICAARENLEAYWAMKKSEREF